MSKDRKSDEEKQKNREIGAKKARVTLEEKRLRVIFDKLSNDAKIVATGLIRRAAYMRVTLEDYEQDINEGGSVELFKQKEGAPSFERVRPVAQLYNSLNKNYQSIIKQLSDLLPKPDPDAIGGGTGGPKSDGYDEWVDSR
jgi:hypothetical protein